MEDMLLYYVINKLIKNSFKTYVHSIMPVYNINYLRFFQYYMSNGLFDILIIIIL